MIAHLSSGGAPENSPVYPETQKWINQALDSWHRAGRK